MLQVLHTDGVRRACDTRHREAHLREPHTQAFGRYAPKQIHLSELVSETLAQYIQALTDLYHEHKDAMGYGDVKLVIL